MALEDLLFHYVNETNGDVTSYYLVGGYLIPAGSYILKEKELDGMPRYQKKEEARYNGLVINLQKGEPLSNFKSSKYYDYYVERLSKEYPEYVI